MDLQFRDPIEKGIRFAFMHYIVRHSNFGDCLQTDCSQLIPSATKIIEKDPEIITAIKDIPEGTVLERIIEAAEKRLPEVVNSLESRCKLVHHEK